jgi:hypothetical protein
VLTTTKLCSWVCPDYIQLRFSKQPQAHSDGRICKLTSTNLPSVIRGGRISDLDDCTVRDEWFIKRSLELRSKMIIIEMSKVQEEQVEQRLFMPALRS